MQPSSHRCPKCSNSFSVPRPTPDWMACPCCGIHIPLNASASGGAAVTTSAMPTKSEQGDAHDRATVSYVTPQMPRMPVGLELIRELARGGLGVVYLARHRVLDDLRAVKRPKSNDGVVNTQLRTRFEREIQAVGSLRHDHIMRAHDAGADEDGPYLVMEYLDGEPLSRLVGQGRSLSVQQACELVRQAALGLQAACEQGLVHRDIKPSNLMLVRIDSQLARLVIIDWGLVKWSRESTSSDSSDDLTTLGTTMGTPDFIAPEQIGDARGVDIRADIYSLGATLYFLLVGKPPFQGRSTMEKFVAQQKEGFPSPSSLRPDISGELVSVLERMVAKDRTQRYSTPAEAAKALEPFCGAEPGLLDLLDGSTTNANEPGAVRSAPSRRRLGWKWAATASLLLLSVVVLVMVLRGRQDHDGSEEPSGGPAVLGEGPPEAILLAGRHPGHCSSLVFTADGLRAVAESGGGGVYVWDLRKRRLDEEHSWLHGLERPDKGPDSSGVVAVSPDGSYLVAASTLPPLGYMNLLSLHDQKTFDPLNKSFGVFNVTMGHALAFSPGIPRLLATEERLGLIFRKANIRILEVPSGKTVTQFPTTYPVRSLAFSPDGKRLAIAGNESILRTRDLDHDQPEREFRGHSAPADCVGFSAEGDRLFSASAGDGTLRIWDAKAGTGEVVDSEMRKIETTGSRMICATFWPGGRALTGHEDGRVVLWDLADGEELKRFTQNSARVTAVAISPDGHHALSAQADGSVYLYRLP